MFEDKTWCCLVTYERRDNGENNPEFTFLSNRMCLLDERNWERKMRRELTWGSASSEADGICVVAYVRADGAYSFEGASYAEVAIEQLAGHEPQVWVGDEIAEQLQLW